MTLVNTGSVRLRLFPVQEKPERMLVYRMEVLFPVIEYYHEETVMGTNIEDIKKSARFIAKAISRDLKASLDDAEASL